MKTNENKEQAGGVNVNCEVIQSLLFDYMSHELGQARSGLVREHLRKCADCQKAAAEIQETLNLLKKSAGQAAAMPDRLSQDRRDRIRWAFTHPVMHWIERHHIMVSMAVAIIIVIVLGAIMMRIKIIREKEKRVSIPVLVDRLPGAPAGNAVSAGNGDRGGGTGTEE